MNSRVLALLLGATAAAGCPRRPAAPDREASSESAQAPSAASVSSVAKGVDRVSQHHSPQPALGDGQTYVYEPDTVRTLSQDEARQRGLLDVDLSDSWAPLIFTSNDPRVPGSAEKVNRYRQTFIDLAADRVDENGVAPRNGDHNYLEPFGIPPTLGVLLGRIDDDLIRGCYASTDTASLRAWQSEVGYFDRDQSRREYETALRDAAWLEQQIAERSMATVAAPVAAPLPGQPATAAARSREAILAELLTDPKVKARIERTTRGQERIKVIRAAQARLTCEGLLQPRARSAPGVFDLPTHEALAAWERKNNVFGWGFLNPETATGLARPALELHFETLKRIIGERVADAAGIIEDGSTASWKTPPIWRDAGGAEHEVPNLIDDFTQVLLRSIHVTSPEEMVEFLRSHGAAGLAKLHVAFAPPPLPPYYAGTMQLDAEIDRGDVWYDFPFDDKGRPIPQPRTRFPQFKLFVTWNGQRIPLVGWRTTIGSWRSEMAKDGFVYYRYKNSDVGRRVWRHVVAGPVWIPPDTTPTKDLLTRKVMDRTKGPETVVNTDVMGPGFQSAYGLVLAIHEQQRGRGFWDNQIRTHGSVDYTSIARRFSHGCHRLVNNRAVRLFDFVLKHRPHKRVGQVPILSKRRFTYEGQAYEYKLDTRGYYYELTPPLPVNVLEGHIMGKVKRPIAVFMRKPGVDYSDALDPNALPASPPNTTPVPTASPPPATSQAQDDAP